ncbi:MAG: hypothetical protein MJ147_01635 [Clostridia bacterium]|nr:hypothetical protein [Clostridia bacterium]
MKKFICIFMALVLVLSTSVCAFAEKPKKDNEYPVIMVAGYSSSKLMMTDDKGNVSQAWGGFDIQAIISYLLNFILFDKRAKEAFSTFTDEQIAKNVGGAVTDLFGHLALDDGGNSINNIKPYLTTAEESSTKALVEQGKDFYITEPEIQAEIANRMGGYDMLYTFNCDFRLGTVECAKELDRFIEDVLKTTGSEKVNIYAVSHGGQTTATYLSLYGYKKQVNNAVLTVPAIGGAALAYDILSGTATLDEENLVRFIEHGMMWEPDLHWLVQSQPLKRIDNIIKLVIPYVLDGALGNWGSLWDFIPAQYYEDVKALRLDPVKNKELIEKSDYVHYELMPNFGENLRKARDEYGVDVSILAGTDNGAVTGLQENSDSIITTNASTGATVAPFGKKFAEGYTAINGDNSYVSPSMTIDASTAYLPDNTWFVSGLFHGMTIKDEYTTELVMKLLLTDDLKDVNSDPAYPQFRATSNKSSKVYFEFKDAPNGKITSQNNTLVITNVSEKNNMRLLAVTSKGMGDVKFAIPKKTVLAPHESVEIKYDGQLRGAAKAACEVTVSYCMQGSVTPVNERTLYFTLDNGEAPQYDANTPYMTLGVYGSDSTLQKAFSEKLATVWYAKILKLLMNIFLYTLKLA